METAGKADSQEPSMEDILASIRRILAEDTGTSPAEPDAAEVPPPPERNGGNAPKAQDSGEATARSLVDDLFPPAAAAPPAGAPFAGEKSAPEAATVGASPAAPSAPGTRAAAHDVFMLSPDMRSRHTLLSAQSAGESTDVLGQLARAILDRRDIAVASRDVTLEGMVREMLRPLLREWLDRNLPYLIERLVKKEIDLMINRAERLED